MFKQLRRQLILINAIVTGVVLIAAFSTIYLLAKGGAKHRPFFLEQNLPPAVEQALTERIFEERQAANRSLLLSLVVIGGLVEAAVVAVSYVLAELSIQPIRRAYETQKLFIANASHEIKTPLAAISANLEAAELEDNRWIKNISREVDTLTELNRSLLTLASADTQSDQMSPKELISAQELINELISEFEPQLKQLGRVHSKKITINAHPPSHPIQINVPPADLRQILKILLDNAIKYCDHEITINFDAQGFSIENDGAIIPEENLSHIFERFYQVDKTSQGVGLGLAIAKTLADKNHWQLSATSSAKTTSFKLNL